MMEGQGGEHLKCPGTWESLLKEGIPEPNLLNVLIERKRDGHY